MSEYIISCVCFYKLICYCKAFREGRCIQYKKVNGG